MIGTGNLQFPTHEASRIMLGEVVSFFDNKPHSSVKDVRFIIFDQDQSLIAVFQQEMRSLQLRRGSVRLKHGGRRLRSLRVILQNREWMPLLTSLEKTWTCPELGHLVKQ